MKRIQDHKFRQLFIIYNTSRNDFAFYHLILDLDDIHLKTKYLDILLIITAVDANNQLFSVVFEVIDTENNQN